MRQDQYIGLTKEALHFLDELMGQKKSTSIHIDWETRQVVTEEVHNCNKEIYSHINGAWTDVVSNLHQYVKDGIPVVREIVQAESWSSGPCYFLCLEDEKGVKWFEWTEEEMNSYL